MNERTKNMIDITGVDLKLFIKKVYDLSKPQGLGFLHYTEGSLMDEDIDNILKHANYNDVILSMDYIKGRACKMVVFKIDDKMWIHDNWFDHSKEQLSILLNTIINNDGGKK